MTYIIHNWDYSGPDHAWLAESRCCATEGMRRSMISWYLMVCSSKHGVFTCSPAQNHVDFLQKNSD